MILRKHRSTLNLIVSSLIIVCFLFSVSSAIVGVEAISTPFEENSLSETKTKEVKQNDDSSDDTTVENPFNESYTVEFENLTATFNQTKYRPETGVNLTIKGEEERLFADLEYELRSPTYETAFKFEQPAEVVFEDPNFNNENVTEWINDTTNGFDNVTIYNAKMLLTLNGTDSNGGNATVFFNNFSLSGTYRVKFTHQNATNIDLAFINETLNFYYWNGEEFTQEALNYSTSGEILYDEILNLNITEEKSPNGILFAFVLNSTQNKVINWTIDNLVVENYQTTIFQDPDFSDTAIPDWFNGTNAFNETEIVEEDDEYYLALTHSAGVGEIYYNLTSLIGEAIIEFDYRNTTDNASKLVFEYWNGTDWISTHLNGTQISEWDHQIILATLGGWNPAENYSLFRFKINATLSSTWNIDNIRAIPLNEPGYLLPVVDLAKQYSSTKTYTWMHEGVNNTITMNTDIFRNGTEPVWVNVTFNLPSEKVILGNWTFRMYTLKSPTGPELPSSLDIDFQVTSDIDFIKKTAFARRGYYNTTEIEPEIGPEPGIIEEPYLTSSEAIFSPGEEIYFMGQLNMTWTNEILWANYTDIGTFQKTDDPTYENAISPIWTGSNTSVNVSLIKWEPGILRGFDAEGDNFTDGAFETPYNDSTYFMLQIKIPERGIYGRVNNSLIVKFAKDESRGASIKVPIELNIKYFVNITRETNATAPNFLERQQLSSWLEGNLTFQPISWNASPIVGMSWNTTYSNYTETTEDNRTLSLVNVTDVLNISLGDIHFDILLNKTVLEARPFQIRRVNNTIYWAGRLDPNLPVGNYTIRLIWTDPAAINDTEIGFLNWAIKGSVQTHLVPIELYGTLMFALISEEFSVEQGETLAISFNVTYQENGAFVSGLYLYANTSRSGNKIFITESNNRYSFDFTPEMNEEAGDVTIRIFKVQADEEIGQMEITIKARKIDSTDDKDSPFALLIALAVAAIVLAGFGFLGLKILR